MMSKLELVDWEHKYSNQWLTLYCKMCDATGFMSATSRAMRSQETVDFIGFHNEHLIPSSIRLFKLAGSGQISWLGMSILSFTNHIEIPRDESGTYEKITKRYYEYYLNEKSKIN